MTPQSMQTLSQVAILVGIVITGAGGFGAYYYGRKVDQQRESAAELREASLQEDIQRLLEGNDSLHSRLQPFEELAKELHPNLEREEALQKLRDNLESVSTRTEELENKVKPRSLSEEQRHSLRERLSSIPASDIHITAVWGDAEAFSFARELGAVFRSAGWQLEEVTQSVFDIPVHGVVISLGQQPPPPKAQAVFRAFKDIGITLEGNLDPNRDDGNIVLWVGSK